MNKSMDPMQQHEITALLKSIPEGETITMVISRLVFEEGHDEDASVGDGKTNGAEITASKHSVEARLREELSRLQNDRELIALDIALNDSPSAGLGISLKAQKTYDDEGNALDSGLYIKNVCFP